MIGRASTQDIKLQAAEMEQRRAELMQELQFMDMPERWDEPEDADPVAAIEAEPLPTG